MNNDKIEIDGMVIENGSVIVEQARHNTEALKRLGILDENGNPIASETPLSGEGEA